MKISKKRCVEDYAHCNFCKRGDYDDKRHQINYPYEEVLEISGNSLTVGICQECIDKLLYMISQMGKLK